MMNENTTEPVSSAPATPHAGIGASLRTAREAMGFSTQEVADRIKFSVRQVEALERDDVGHLPQGTFLRGFIRSYARVLHLEPESLLAQTETRMEHQHDWSEVQAGGQALPSVSSTERNNLYLLIGALIIALGIAVFLFTQRDKGTPATAEQAAVQTPPAMEAAVSAVPVTATQKTEIVEVAPPKAVKVQAPTPQIKEEKSPAVAGTAPPPAKREVPLEQLMKRPIHFVFLQDAWVEVKDVNGEVLISRVTAAGEEKWVGGNRRAPYQVNIGKVEAIRLYYKGKEVDLSNYQAAGVARLVLE